MTDFGAAEDREAGQAVVERRVRCLPPIERHAFFARTFCGAFGLGPNNHRHRNLTAPNRSCQFAHHRLRTLTADIGIDQPVGLYPARRAKRLGHIVG